MKCNRCSKPATFHITDIAKGVPQEFHLCEEHARQHLTPEESDDTPESQVSALAKGLVKSSSARDTSELDRQTCPVCGITFLEFRNAGRLGCPHDYHVFQSELIPLLENIHGETRHCGKVPKRAPRDSRRQTELIQLRNALKRAVAAEKYEEAAELRDRIRRFEEPGSATSTH